MLNTAGHRHIPHMTKQEKHNPCVKMVEQLNREMMSIFIQCNMVS